MPRRRSGKKIDFVHWTLAQSFQAALAAGTVAGTMFTAQHLSETLLRMRGNLMAFIDGNQATGGGARFGVGLILVPEGTGATVLWSPITDGDAPWIWVDYFALSYEEMVADVIDVPGITSYRSVIDNKAMRIIRNQEVQIVVENQVTSGAISANFSLQVRALFGT